MSRILCALVLVLGVMVNSVAGGAASPNSVVGSPFLNVNGEAAGAVRRWSGADRRANVMTDGAGDKSLGPVSITPLTVEMSLPLAAPLLRAVNGFCNGTAQPLTLVLTEYDFNSRPTMSLEIGATLSEVHFPGLDASTVQAPVLSLVFAVSTVGSTSSNAMSRDLNRGNPLPMFRVKVDGLDARNVRRLGALSLVRAASAGGPPGVSGGNAAAGVEISNLSLMLPAQPDNDWKTWFDNFVVRGRNGPSEEKSGSIEFLSQGGTVGFELILGPMGITRLSRVDQGGTMATEAEMYVERVSFAGPTPPPASGSGTATKAASEAGSNPPATPTAAGSETVSTPAVVGAPSPAVLTGTVQEPKRPAVIGNADPADQGTRDPAEFPRVSGLVRTSYTGGFQKLYTQETATYSSKEDMNVIAIRIFDAAKKGGWEMKNLTEGGTPGVNRSVNAELVKATITAQVTCHDTKANGLVITISVTNRRP